MSTYILRFRYHWLLSCLALRRSSLGFRETMAGPRPIVPDARVQNSCLSPGREVILGDVTAIAGRDFSIDGRHCDARSDFQEPDQWYANARFGIVIGPSLTLPDGKQRGRHSIRRFRLLLEAAELFATNCN